MENGNVKTGMHEPRERFSDFEEMAYFTHNERMDLVYHPSLYN